MLRREGAARRMAAFLAAKTSINKKYPWYFHGFP